ncbi:MAG: hypothetical protein IJ578_00625 [Bacteroidales bacterium]|nr:hypothetical protein [Bacteroidales bacterium]
MYKSFPRIPVLAGILMLVSLPGCSVWEDRDLCPAQLVLRFPPLDGPAVLVLEAGQERLVDTLATGTQVYRTRVPRGAVRIQAACPPEGFDTASGTLAVPPGSGFPETMLFSRRYDCVGEQLSDSLQWRKHFCRLGLRITCPAGTPPYSFAVSGNVAGLDAEGRAQPGIFRCRVLPDPSGRCRICLPRQPDASLMLEILAEGSPVSRFALGEFLAAAGYDWTAENLEDTEVEVDYVRTSLTLRWRGWTETFRFNVVI